MNYTRPTDNTQKEGMVLFFVLGGLGLLGLLGLTAYTVSRQDALISRNHMRVTQSLNQADAGVEYVKSQVESRLTLGESLQQIVDTLNVTAPTGYDFDPVTVMKQHGNTNLFTFSVTGRSGAVGTPDGNGNTTIEATVRRGQAINIGVFGIEELDLRPNVDIWSYNSGVTTNPAAADSTGEASVGSNQNIAFQPSVNLDGTVSIGADIDETEAACSGCDSFRSETVGHVEEDPLGMFGGTLADQFASAAIDNDNDLVPEITGGNILMANTGTTIIPSGDYYLSEITFKGDVTVSVLDGPVNIFLTGQVKSFPGYDINVLGKPTNFRIFSNSSEDIKILPRHDFRGFIYAPYAQVFMAPEGDFFGGIWSLTTILQPGGSTFVDTALFDAFQTTKLDIVSWKETRE